jgi:hypothetical protein
MIKVLLVAGAAASGVVLLSLAVTAVTGRRAHAQRRADPQGGDVPAGLHREPTAGGAASGSPSARCRDDPALGRLRAAALLAGTLSPWVG